MTTEEYTWTINLVKDRHHQFNLSFQQAEKVYKLEQEKELHAVEHYFSFWEEEDYKLENYQQILDENQFRKFLTSRDENIKTHERFLIDSDKEQLKYISYYTELIDFYKQRFTPDFFKKEFIIESVTLSKYRSKLTMLKNEYKSYLENTKLGYITSHYRHNRLFMPNQLKATRLRHDLSYIVPDFFSFKRKMDKPTKATAEFLLDKFQHIPERHEAFFKAKSEEFGAFQKEIKARYIGETKGWSVTLSETKKQKKENRIMLFILLDKDAYSS